MAQLVKSLPAMCETQVQSWVGKIPWRREWLPIPWGWILAPEPTVPAAAQGISIRNKGDFPGGPVVKTLSFQCRGSGFGPWLVKFKNKFTLGMIPKGFSGLP